MKASLVFGEPVHHERPESEENHCLASGKKKKKNHQGSQFQPSLAEGKLRQHCILRFLLHTTYLKQKTQTAVKLFSVN